MSCHFQAQDARHARFDVSRQATRRTYTEFANPSLQCDGVQPVCQRCLKARRSCYGMNTGRTGSVVHIENSYASGQKKRPRGPRPNPTVELVGTLDSPSVILPNPPVDLKTQAIMYYTHYHLQTLKDAQSISRGIIDDFLPIWTSRAQCPILDLALSSMALAVFSRTQQHPLAAMEASAKYHQLLQTAQTTIPSLNEGNVNVCLLAIFFMGRYEDAIHRPSHLIRSSPSLLTFQSFSHHDGALAILEIWKDRLSHTQPATDVVKHTRRGLIRSALLRNLVLPNWILEGASFGERGLELEYDRIVVRTLNARHRLSTLLKEKTQLHRISHDFIDIAEELNQDLRDTDKALRDWTVHIPRTWSFQRHTLADTDPWPTKDFYSPTVCSYTSPGHAAVWHHYHAMRLLINSTRLRALKLRLPSSDDFANEPLLECLSNIRAIASDLASSVPFCLEKFRVATVPKSSCHQKTITLNTTGDIKPPMASLIVWPITIASSLEDVDFKQRLWFRSQIARIGRILGVGVFESAETDPWLEL